MAKEVNKIVIITGVQGQDGSFLAEHLLELGYYVVGVTRRKSTETSNKNLENVLNNKRFKLIYGSITDPSFVNWLIQEYKPEKYFNLAAASHVGQSFTEPNEVFSINASAVIFALDSIRRVSPETKLYQASTSELFGGINCPDTGYNEDSKFHPRSPYGVAKLAAHWSTINFREAYGIFSCAGILFNHECLTSQVPVIIKKNNMLDILPIEELVLHRENPLTSKRKQSSESSGIDVWDGGSWTKIKTMTATWNDEKNDKEVIRVLSRGGFYEATSDHISFLDNEVEIKTSNIIPGDYLQLKKLPNIQNKTSMSLLEAELLGLLCADGSISNNGQGKFINKDLSLINKVKNLWETVSCGYCSFYENKSGYKEDSIIYNLNLNGNSNYLKMIRKELYTESSKSRVPKRILNSGQEEIIAFLRGFNLGDGTKAGGQKTEFKCFTTDSQTLALGLWYLVESALKLRMTLYTEERDERIYYKININSTCTSGEGKHLIKDSREVKKVKKLEYKGWLFDLETDSGTFSAGIGNTWVHNSPRRPIDFVTRKVTNGVARIKAGLDTHIIMGNMEAYRDWGYAKDYVKMMNLMLDSDTPQEYVIATGKVYSIEHLAETAFGLAGIYNWKDYIKTDERFMRPSEVPFLLGNPTKAMKELSWNSETSFEELIKIMLYNDLKNYSVG
jgi:GDPmannose 4,6-dehydratase